MFKNLFHRVLLNFITRRRVSGLLKHNVINAKYRRHNADSVRGVTEVTKLRHNITRHRILHTSLHNLLRRMMIVHRTRFSDTYIRHVRSNRIILGNLRIINSRLLGPLLNPLLTSTRPRHHRRNLRKNIHQNSTRLPLPTKVSRLRRNIEGLFNKCRVNIMSSRPYATTNASPLVINTARVNKRLLCSVYKRKDYRTLVLSSLRNAHILNRRSINQ